MLSSTKTKQIQKGMIRGAVAHRRPMSKISLGGGEVVTIAAESPRVRSIKIYSKQLMQGSIRI